MPRYDFKDKNTGEVFEKIMKIAEKEQYLKDNPNMESHIGTAPAIGDSVRLGVRKADNGFKDVLQQIHQRTPGSNLNTIANI
jgi:hypothetical protein